MNDITEKQCVLLLTDSLGCPRTETNVADTWTDKIIRTVNSGYYYYTMCEPGIFYKKIDLYCIYEINPKIIVIQVGVVDACRRAMSIGMEKIIRKIPILSRVVRFICKKYHYAVTKIYNIHYSTKEDVTRVCLNIINNTNAKIVFIPIAPASTVMNRNTYNFANDVEEYNKIFNTLSKEYNRRIFLLDPYSNVKKIDELFLGDGHHLSKYGIDLLYISIKEKLEELCM